MTQLLHATDTDTEPDTDGPGGYWVVMCHKCGWTRAGRYGGILLSQAYALSIGHRLGTKHEEAMNGVTV